MKLIASTNTAGSWAATFQTPAGANIDLSGYTIEASILSDLNGTAMTVNDGGLSTSVGGTGNATLTWSINHGHGLAPGVYYVQTRYHTGDANWRDLHKGQLTIGAKGGCSSHLSICSYDGSVATDVVVAVVSGYSAIDGGVADSTYPGSAIDGGTA